MFNKKSLTFWKDITNDRISESTPLVLDTNALRYIRKNECAEILTKALFGKNCDSLKPFPSNFPVSLVTEYGGASIASRRAQARPWTGEKNTSLWLEESWHFFDSHNHQLASAVYDECRHHFQSALQVTRSKLSQMYISAALQMIEKNKTAFVSSLKIRLTLSDLFRTLIPREAEESVSEFRKSQLACLAVQFSTLIQNDFNSDFLRLGFEMTQGIPALFHGLFLSDIKLRAFKITSYEPRPNSDLGDSEILELLLLGARYGQNKVPVRVVTTDPYESIVTRLKIARFVMSNLFERISDLTGETDLINSWCYGTVTIVDSKKNKVLTLEVESISEVESINSRMKPLMVMLNKLQYLIWRTFRWQ